MPPRRRRVRRQDVVAITHPADSRRNIPTAEMEAVLEEEDRAARAVAYERRNRDLDPQLVWRGKDEQDAGERLIVAAPPLFAQEKVHPKVLIDDLVREARARRNSDGGDEDVAPRQPALDLFADFNGLHDANARTEFYQHEINWANRLILGDSLQVMASLAEREGLRGQVQCIYIDPPYGIKFNSNFQWSTTSREVRDGHAAHITREPEQVKAFRDTWRDGIHSYLSYLRDRLTVARDLLADSGSIFVQIGDENVHRVRVVMDEVFGEKHFVSMITYRTSSGTTQRNSVKRVSDYIIWYCKDIDNIKFRRLLESKNVDTKMYNQLEMPDGSRRPMTRAERDNPEFCPPESRPYQKLPVHSMASGDHTPKNVFNDIWRIPPMRSWRYSPDGFDRLVKASRIQPDKTALRAVYYNGDYPAYEISNSWEDTGPEINKSYIVQTSLTPIQRCILMTTAPGDLVLDPTCGAGTTAYVAEQWGRRWITIDTSRVALALARMRLMGARYPYWLLADSPAGQRKEAEIRRREMSEAPTGGDIRHGFVYRRVPHITLRDIANNAEIDAIYDAHQAKLEPLRARLNAALGEGWEEWEIPRQADDEWPAEAAALHRQWWETRLARQREIDASIAAHANFEYLYDRPYDDAAKTRVSGPFTVESLSPHTVMPAEMDAGVAETGPGYPYDGAAPERDFAALMLETLRHSGVQQASRGDKIDFTSLVNWPGHYICAEGRYAEGDGEAGDANNGGGAERRAGIFIGPEFGTVSRQDLILAARETADAGFDVLIACAFSYDAHASELNSLGRVPVIKARMNADLHMAGELKGSGNLFVVFGEPDVELLSESAPAGGDSDANNDEPMLRVKINGVDVFDPSTGQVRSDSANNIACWFVDTDYNDESFFVRQAYFLGASSDPYRALKTTLKAEIDADAWATLRSEVSRPFPRPPSGRIAVKVINHLGDEAMKVLTAG